MVQSTGGLYDVAQARRDCVHMLESGPAAGVIAGRALARAAGIENAITFDMGGTTAKSGVIHGGEALTTGSAKIGGYEQGLPVQIAMMDIFEVGTGGGSIARTDAQGALRVGPESAGASPGPACYGAGGTAATVTDANLVLGRIAADRFLGGAMTLDSAAALAAMKSGVADPLGMDPVEAAAGVLQIAATAMSFAVKGVSTERGLDAGAFALVACGGAGPLHASAVAREIGMREIVVPPAPGHFSAIGMLHADLRYDYVRTWFARLAEAPLDGDRAALRRDGGGGTGGGRRHRRGGVGDRRRARRRHALCRPGARGDGRPARRAVRRRRPGGDQAALRRGARHPLRHLGAGRAGRAGEPAHDGFGPPAQAADGAGRRGAGRPTRRRSRPGASISPRPAASSSPRSMQGPGSASAPKSAGRR